MDDASPLRQINPQVSGADLWLFKPAIAYRVRPGSDEGTPVPMDEALAENPPAGAVIDYWLKEKAKGPAQLEIFDSEGALVRRFSSDDLLQKTNPQDVPIAIEWIHDPAPFSARVDAGRPPLRRRSARRNPGAAGSRLTRVQAGSHAEGMEMRGSPPGCLSRGVARSIPTLLFSG